MACRRENRVFLREVQSLNGQMSHRGLVLRDLLRRLLFGMILLLFGLGALLTWRPHCISSLKVSALPSMSVMSRIVSKRSSPIGHHHRPAVTMCVHWVTPNRHPDDPFDRIWTPSGAPASLTLVENAAVTVSANINDLPPSEILQAALTPIAGINTITLVPPVSGEPVPVYINLYFTEVDILGAGDRRSFIIYVDNAAASGAITPPFGGVGEFFITDLSMTNSTRITLRATSESTLPPVISAMEAFMIVERRKEAEGDAAGAVDDGCDASVLDPKEEL
ncbi:Uncharacterized protein AXF42_Ash014850 [Apostasia shenzhenica]|uniref:Malectin-like domain-containing protein n=1 Tax=Apostasia shenzhenica TaxID=1088818 RepID=A0A2I0ALD4_9ASPA|nr:Uncharacterized protein AXF42_Ash014850 [Apostasia shenzhenica]